MNRPRFEDTVTILIVCCKKPMVLGGNLSLRGVSGKSTVLAYECKRCFKRVAVTDEWLAPGPSALQDIEDTP